MGNNWNPLDYIVAGFAAFIILFMLTFLVYRLIRPLDVNDPQAAEIVENVLITVLSIITIYVGSKLRHNK